MKVKMEELRDAVNSVSATKSQITMAVDNEQKVGTFVSTDSQMGIKVMTRFPYTGSFEETDSIYMAAGLNERVNALAPYGDSVNIVKANNMLKFVAGEAKFNVGMLNDKPADIATGEQIGVYQISGKEFLFAMGQTSYAPTINLIFKKDELIICALTDYRISAVTVPVLRSDVPDFSVEDTDDKPEEMKRRVDLVIDSTNFIVDEDRGEFMTAISKDVWSRISSICKDEYFCIFVYDNQLQFVWNKVAISLPITPVVKGDMNFVRKTSTEATKTENSIEFDVNSKTVLDALNLVSISGETEVNFRGDDGELEIYTLSGSAKIKAAGVTEFSQTYNGKHMKGILSINKNTDLKVIVEGPILIMDFCKEFEHCFDEKEPLKNKLDVHILVIGKGNGSQQE